MSQIVIVVDTDTGKTDVHNLDKGTGLTFNPESKSPAPVVASPTYVSEIAQAFALAKGEPVPVGKEPAWVSQQPAITPSVSGTFTVVNGKHYDLPLPASQERLVFRRNVGEVAEIALHVQIPVDYVAKDVSHVGWLKIAGATSGDVHGGAAASFGQKDAPGGQPMMEGQINSYQANFTVGGPIHAVKPGEFVNVFLRLDGGDAAVYVDILSPNAY